MKVSMHFKALTAAVAVSIAGAAGAAPASLPLTINGTFNSTQWFVGNQVSTSGSCGGTAFGVVDASSAGGGDAYDDAWGFQVNGFPIGAPGNTVDLTGSTLTAGPVSAGGMNVTVQQFYAQGSSLARFMVFLQNPGSAAAVANVQVPINFGSDGGTLYQATSSGDTAVSPADRWIVSSDGGPSDPVNTTVLFGPGATVQPVSTTTSVFDCAGPNGLGATFNVSVPAGSTRSLMFFAGLAGITEPNNTVASAVTSAALFDSSNTLLPEWVSGLSSTQKSQIANWNFFTTCAAEGYTGGKLTLCRSICETTQAPSTLSSKIKLYSAIYRETPPCGL